MPDAVQLKIASFLKPQGITNVSVASGPWHEVRPMRAISKIRFVTMKSLTDFLTKFAHQGPNFGFINLRHLSIDISFDEEFAWNDGFIREMHLAFLRNLERLLGHPSLTSLFLGNFSYKLVNEITQMLQKRSSERIAFKNIQRLQVSNHRLQWFMSDRVIFPLAHIPKLNHLIVGSKAEGMTDVGFLENIQSCTTTLHHLDLRDASFGQDEDDVKVKCLTSLGELNLLSFTLTTTDNSSNLTALDWQLFFSKQPNLEVLNVGGFWNSQTDEYDEDGVEVISISANSRLTDECFQLLASERQLGKKNFPKLPKLRIGPTTHLTLGLAKTIAEISTLQSLHLVGNGEELQDSLLITNHVLVNLGRYKTNISDLILSNIDWVNFNSIKNLKKLEHLTLNNINSADAILEGKQIKEVVEFFVQSKHTKTLSLNIDYWGKWMPAFQKMVEKMHKAHKKLILNEELIQDESNVFDYSDFIHMKQLAGSTHPLYQRVVYFHDMMDTK